MSRRSRRPAAPGSASSELQLVVLDFDDTMVQTSSTRRPLFEALLCEVAGIDHSTLNSRLCWGSPFEQMVERQRSRAEGDYG